MCGVFGIYGHEEASNLTYLGLHSLQHRGQESAGIVSSGGGGLPSYKEMGLGAEIISADVLQALPGPHAIGNARFSTAGGSHLKNAQPLFVSYQGGQLAVAHNGNIVNAQSLKDELESTGAIFQSDSDTEVLIR